MNKEKLQLMSTMLGEVIENKWKGLPVDHLLKLGPVKLIGQNIKEFDLGTWVTKSECGFAACAVGHACYDKRFQDLGLYAQGNQPMFMGADDVYHTWDAVEKFFEITYETALLLFMPSAYEEFYDHGVMAGQVKSRVDELLLFGEEEFNENHKPKVKDEVAE